MTIVLGWWAIPLAITAIAIILAWWFSSDFGGGGRDYGAGALIGFVVCWVPAIVVTLLAWLIYALAT